MDSEDGEFFVKQLAGFVRTHEKALANALQFKRQPVPRHAPSQSAPAVIGRRSSTVSERPSTSASSSSTNLAAALSLGSLSLASHSVKSARLALTPHHLFYLLSRFEELGIPVGPMKVRLENLHDTSTSTNYVSFLSSSQRSKSRGSDAGSIHSVSSVRSVMSGMSAIWAAVGLGGSISAARNERQKAAIQADLKYLYSAFTKIPCLRLAPDKRARLIRGYEEFPFDSAVPLYIFKNVQALEVASIDFRQFFGWDRMAEQLRSLTLKRAGLEDPAELLIDIVLDDMDRRRRRSSKSRTSPTIPWTHIAYPRRSNTMPLSDWSKSFSPPGSPEVRNSSTDAPVGSVASDNAIDDGSPTDSRRESVARNDGEEAPGYPTKQDRPRSTSPLRPTSARNQSTPLRSSHSRVRRSGSCSSHSSLSDSWHHGHHARGSSGNLLASILPPTKWRFLKHLSLADNSMTAISATSLAPLSNTLFSLDLSSNLFTQIPDSLATLTALRALNLSSCMIDSLHSLTRNPLPAITALNLRANRLQSIAGVERLYPLERLDLRDNRITDPSELARLTGIPDIREIWVEGNPFTRTHRNYRIAIFNLFRRTPGCTEDIMIDGSGPTYSEKRQLVDRVPIPEAVPVVKPAPPPVTEVDVGKPVFQNREASVLRKERPTPKAVSSEVNTNSTRRKKASKRRIVDLAHIDPSAEPVVISETKDIARMQKADTPETESHYRISHPEEGQANPSGAPDSPDGSQFSDTPRIDSTVVGGPPPVYASKDNGAVWKDSHVLNVNGELYRHKVEAYQNMHGRGYLRALNEESRDASQPPEYDFPSLGPAPTLRPSPALSRTTSQAILSGRTLG